MHYLIKKSDKKILERSLDLRFIETLHRIHNESLPCYVLSCYSEFFQFKIERSDLNSYRVIKKEDVATPRSS